MNTLRITSCILTTLLLSIGSVFSKNATAVFTAESEIVSSPTLTDDYIIITSIDSVCYALSISDYSLQWKYKSKSPLRSSALVVDNRVYIETGNAVTCLELKTGKFLWKSPDNMCTRTTEVDQWDYYRSGLTYHQGVLYAGDDFGWIYGTDTTGKRVFEYHTGAFSVIHATPTIHDSIIYFGNYDGTVYAYGMREDSLLYTIDYVKEKPYDFYGAIMTPVVVAEEVMLWGGRNSTVYGFDYKSRVNRWSYKELSEAWLTGTPTLYKDKVFIGGSDSKAMYCFNAKSGKFIWKSAVDQNIFSPAVVTKNYVVVCDQNAYDSGYGIVYYMTHKKGDITDRVVVKGNIVSTPVFMGKTLLVTTRSGVVYAIK